MWSIAQQNSLIGGKGVHKARALLNLIMDEPEISANRWEETGLSELAPVVALYPNPSDGEFYLHFNAPIIRVVVTDALGRIIKECLIQSGENNLIINLSAYSSGIYFFQCSDGLGFNNCYKGIITK